MNDERPIEKLLRRAAKKRSAEADPPPDLHPANRRVLQGEVARQFPQQSAPNAAKQSALAEFWTGLTQRWVYAIGIFVVLGVAALVILPTLFKSKPETNLHLAQSVPGNDRLAKELAKNESAPSEPPATPSVTMELDSAQAVAPAARNLALAPETASAPPAAVAPMTSAPRQSGARSNVADAAAPLAETVANSATPAPMRSESTARLMVADDATGASRRTTPASGAPRPQVTRSGGGSGGAGGGNVAAISPDSRFGTEENRAGNIPVTEQKRADSFATAGATTSGAVPTEGFADKTWLPRGGGVERERAAFNSQAYSNVGLERSQALKKETQALKDIVPVLANFRIEQAGRDMRVVDGDGSIYKGVVDEENTLYKQMMDRQNLNVSNAYENKFKFQTPKTAEVIGAAKQQVADYYLYRVEGTNRSLNQNVVFTWNFVPTNEALAATQLNYKEALQKTDATKLPSQLPALLPNSYINGRAQWGDNKQIEVNAVPVKP